MHNVQGADLTLSTLSRKRSQSLLIGEGAPEGVYERTYSWPRTLSAHHAGGSQRVAGCRATFGRNGIAESGTGAGWFSKPDAVAPFLDRPSTALSWPLGAPEDTVCGWLSRSLPANCALSLGVTRPSALKQGSIRRNREDAGFWRHGSQEASATVSPSHCPHWKSGTFGLGFQCSMQNLPAATRPTLWPGTGRLATEFDT
jgi:hypothetical protein